MNYVEKHQLKDFSTTEKFIFALECAHCGQLQLSTPIAFSKAGAVPDSEAKKLVYATLYRKEKELAMERALRELRTMFSECPICMRRVCDECFLICEELDMCVSCAGRLHERGEPVLLKQISI
ncbi:MAG: hypothetical protein IKV79_02045 [Oscillospiraceae bacterium]|nr:hypothetical protein [Oscillospiraceae bacterium]